MNQRKNLTLAAGIINIIAYTFSLLTTCYLGYMVFVLFLLVVDLGGDTTAAGTFHIILMAIAVIVKLILSIVSIVLSAKSFKLGKVSAKEFDSKKSKIVSIIVINFILVALIALAPIMPSELAISLIYDLFVGVFMIAVAILYIVALSKNKALLKEEAQAQTIAAAPVSEAPAESTFTPSEPEHTANPAPSTDKIEHLEKLCKMKADGLISDEEYEKLKADILSK